MKKIFNINILLILTIILFLTTILYSCDDTYTKKNMCEDILDKRLYLTNSVNYNNKIVYEIQKLDSLFFKCGCDTLK